MASLAHVSLGLAAGKWHDAKWRSLVFYAALAMLPDADVIAFVFRIPYSAPFGHRGASHSFVFALIIALIARFALKQPLLLVFAVVASHPLLDMLTDGGLGCAVFWPFTSERFFFPWQPIPVAPIGAGLFSARGAYVLTVEFIATLPLIIYALIRRPAAAR